jgi:ribosomal protein S18 acetylase RimI-like enzyme
VHGDDEVRSWFAEVVLRQREVWLAETDGQAVAVLVLDDGWIDQLYVHPYWWRRGVGTRLVEQAKHRRPAGLQLWTFQSNAAAQHFYEAHGFVAEERTAGEGNEERAPDIRYRWRA